MLAEFQNNTSSQSDTHERELRQRPQLSALLSFCYRPSEVVVRMASKDGLSVERKTNKPKHFTGFGLAFSQQGILFKFLLAEPILFNPAYFMLATIVDHTYKF